MGPRMWGVGECFPICECSPVRTPVTKNLGEIPRGGVGGNLRGTSLSCVLRHSHWLGMHWHPRIGSLPSLLLSLVNYVPPERVAAIFVSPV